MERKGPLVAALVVILLAAAGSTYLFLYSPSISSSTTSPISQAQSIQRTTSDLQFTNATAQVAASAVTCKVSNAACIVTLVNTGGTAVGATGCTLNGLSGVFEAAVSQIPPGGKVDVSCAPSAGGAIPIPRFHVEGFILLSDGSSVHYTGNWA